MKMKLTCPVCGEHNFSAVNSLETCPVCGWKNDQYQTEHIFVRNGTNKFSLAQSRKAFRIMNLEYEVGYGTDNLLWGVGKCDLCKQKICVDECQHKIQQILNGATPVGAENLEQAKKTCARCIILEHKFLNRAKNYTHMTEQMSNRDTYGDGEWGIGSAKYDMEFLQGALESLAAYCKSEAENEKNNPEPEPNIPDFDVHAKYFMQMMAADETPRRNYTSYFYTSLLSIVDFVDYVTSVHNHTLAVGDLVTYGQYAADKKYKFSVSEKHYAEQVLHISLSYFNYRCDMYGNAGLYYLDNAYFNWDPTEFDDAIAAWFVDIGDDLNVVAINEFIKQTIAESCSYTHVKLALHLLDYLGYDKTDSQMQKNLQTLAHVPELNALVNNILKN